MRTRLLTVADRFELRGRGVVVVPLITRHELPEPVPTAVTLQEGAGVPGILGEKLLHGTQPFGSAPSKFKTIGPID